jgi:hypothetical protein
MLIDIDYFFVLWCYLDVKLFDTIGFNIRCDYNLSIEKEPREM